MDIQQKVFDKVVRFMKDNNVKSTNDIYSDAAFGNAYQFISDLFSIVEPELDKTTCTYWFSLISDSAAGHTEVWLGNYDKNDNFEIENEEVLNIINELNFEHMSQGVYHSPFYPNYIKQTLLKSSYFKYNGEMQARME